VKRLLAVVILVACGGRSSEPAHPVATGSGNPPRAGGEVATATPADRGDEQCDKLFAHALTLGIAERPADQKLTSDERANADAQLHKSWLTSCRQMTSREYDCAMRAATLAELEGC
jgi:hypothetical protein